MTQPESTISAKPRFQYKEGEHWRVDPETGCWEWLKYRDPRGYGRCAGTRAYRAVWEQFGNPIAPGIHLHHVCENPTCVNPGHLVLADGSAHLKHHWRGKSRFTVEDIITIRERAAAGEWLKDIAPDYGVHRGTIEWIVEGRMWKEVGGPAAPTERDCAVCGRTFTLKHRARKYCSGTCRQRAYVQRNGGHWKARAQ